MTGIIILAAGASTRMGQPKQQLMCNGQTLLQKAVDAALQVENSRIAVVLGANYEVIADSIKHRPVQIIYNADWENGMSSSIKTGLNALLSEDNVDDALIMLCDQPFVDAALLNNLLGMKPSDYSYIIACKYGNSVGVPAIFSKSYFDELLALNGQEGAKKVLLRHADKLLVYEFEKGGVDIDTPDDYLRFSNNEF